MATIDSYKKRQIIRIKSDNTLEVEHPETQANQVVFTNENNVPTPKTIAGNSVANVDTAISALDTALASAGKVDKLKLNNVVIEPDANKVVNIATNGTYSATEGSTNYLATETTVTNAINALDAASVGANGSYLKTISETNGVISAEAKAFDTSFTSVDNTNAPTSKAVKDFVNSSIENMAAFYVTTRTGSGTEESPYEYVPFPTKASLTSTTTVYIGGVAKTPGKNDYCIVLADESKKGELATAPTTRYTYTKENTLPYDTSAWEFQYIVNNTGFTSAQMNTINSGIVAADKEKLMGIEPGAQVNVIENVTVGGKLTGTTTITNKVANINVTNVSEAAKVANSLTFGSKTYDGSAAKEILASDLGAITSVALTGDVTGSGTSSIATTIATGAVSTAKLAVPTGASLPTGTALNAGYSAFKVNSKGQVLQCGHAIEWGDETTSTPSDDLMDGGLFFLLQS